MSKHMIGKTISNIIEDPGQDKVVLVFTDGTKTAISFWASYADDQGMEIEELNENLDIPDAYIVRHKTKGYYVRANPSYWDIHQIRASVITKTLAETVVRHYTGPIYVDYSKEDFVIEPVYKIIGN